MSTFPLKYVDEKLLKVFLQLLPKDEIRPILNNPNVVITPGLAKIINDFNL